MMRLIVILAGLLTLGSCAQMFNPNMKSPACKARFDRIRADIHDGSSRRGGRSRVDGRYQCVFTDWSGASWNASWNFSSSGGKIIGTALASGDSSSMEGAVRGNRLLLTFADGDADEFEIVGRGLTGHGSRECGRAKVTCTHR